MEEERWLRVEDWLLNHLADVQDRAFIIMPRDLAAYEEMMRRCGSGFSGSVMVPAASECVFTDAAKVDLDAAKVDLDAAKVDLDAAKVDSDAVKVDSDAAKVDSDAVKVDLDAAKVDLDAAKVDLDAAKVDSDAAKVDSDAAKVDSDAAKVDSDAAKVDSDAAKVDSDAAKVNSDAAKVDLDSVRVRQKRGLSPNHLDGNEISCPSNAWENHRKGAGVRRRAAATPQGPGHPFRSRPRLPAPFFLKCRRADSQPGRRAAAAPWGRCRSQRFSGRAG
jgi:hypothetical protein